ncbi:MAG: UDP-N-acetylmuramate dehydrogenase [Bacilli bacterium]|nr:UDP-N-acetylmuramate dehydrogenase [Bacilli bacterium]
MKKIENLKIGKILNDISLEKYTTYKLKEKAKMIIIPDDINKLIELIKYLEIKKIKYKIIGEGSNLIFDKNYDGVLIKLEKIDDLKINNNIITVGAGYSLIKLALKVSKLGLTGMEFATGIPGTVGGAVFNNAGAYKSDMGYIVHSIKVLTPDKKIETLYNKDLNYHYRTSFLKEHPEYICLEAKIILKKGKKEAIMEVINDRRLRRIEAQPLNYPSAGSVFRNPDNNFAGKLIEDVGFKGKIIGGAKVSEKHANFIVNYNNAKGSDIVTLINQIKENVKNKFNIELILEQEIVD